MKPLQFVLFGLCLLLFSSCGKHEVRLVFDLSSPVSTPCRITYFEEGEKGGVYRENAADIRDGKGKFRIPAYYPTLLFLYPASGRTASAIIYAEPGDEIKITGSGEDMAAWNIEANKTSDELSVWYKKNSPLISRNDRTKLNEAAAEFVNKNPDSKAAAIILFLFFDRRNHEAEFLNLKSKINKKILSDKDFMRALSLADQIAGLDDAYNIPNKIVRTGISGYVDSLELKKSKSTLLIFRNGSSNVKSYQNDSIGKLISANKALTVAEFFGDPDSLAWRREIERDSIAGMKRFWMPLGLADSISISMGVKRFPYLIVVDSVLKVRYRGDDLKEASKVLK